MRYQHCRWQRQVVDVSPLQQGNRVCQNPQLTEAIVGMNWPVVDIRDDEVWHPNQSVISSPVTCQAGCYSLLSQPRTDQSQATIHFHLPPHARNSLPVCVCLNCKIMLTFRWKLKTFLFRSSFGERRIDLVHSLTIAVSDVLILFTMNCPCSISAIPSLRSVHCKQQWQ